MKKILYFCNRCKREIEDNPAKIIMETVDRENGDCPVEVPYPELVDMDFCKDCVDFFAGLVRRHCDKGVPAVPNKEFEKAVQSMVEEQADPPPTEKKKTGRKIDVGKVNALRNAGWSVKAIADEMSCSEQAVYNVLKKLNTHVDKKKAPEPKPTEQSKTS